MKRIHCLGVVVLDALSGPLSRYPEPRGASQVVTKQVRFAAGGGAANTASALARMGLGAGVFSKLGDDFAGNFLRDELGSHGVDCAGIRVSPTEATPFTFVAIHSSGERTFIHTPGANLTFSARDLDLERLLDCGFLVYQDLWVKPQLDGEAGAAILAEARRRGIVTVLDECYGLGPDERQMEAMLPHCDYFVPSLDDMRVVYPGASAESIADRLLGGGARTVVLKMGAEGCLVAGAAGRRHVPAFPTQVVDSTGAGDCWDAGFVAALAMGEDVHAAALIGNAAASFCLRAVGGSAGVPSYAEVRGLAMGGRA
jgi:sugar/nucleoside kinase (ribokinase family)